MSFLRFLASTAGRWTRIGVGLLIIVVGLAATSGAWLVALVLIGLVPLWAGETDHCVLAPLMKRSFRGPELRKSLGAPAEAPLFPRRRVHA